MEHAVTAWHTALNATCHDHAALVHDLRTSPFGATTQARWEHSSMAAALTDILVMSLRLR